MLLCVDGPHKKHIAQLLGLHFFRIGPISLPSPEITNGPTTPDTGAARVNLSKVRSPARSPLLVAGTFTAVAGEAAACRGTYASSVPESTG